MYFNINYYVCYKTILMTFILISLYILINETLPVQMLNEVHRKFQNIIQLKFIDIQNVLPSMFTAFCSSII